MRATTWYADKEAKQLHTAVSAHLTKMISQLCPGYELSHMGVNRNDITEEVQIRLHLNKIGRVRVVPENSTNGSRPHPPHLLSSKGNP